jgi:N-acetylglucosaminyl-diphospho-decaprenol L-rhamnosyltransferase
MKVELVILNYNGRHHLEHLLPTAIREAQSYGLDCRVVVVDNLSPDDDATWVRENYPSVEVWLAPKNEYLFSYNEYAKQSTAEILVLLNNDLKLCENFLPPLLRHFSSPDVFSVGATSLDWEGREFTCGPAVLKYENGFYSWNYQTGRQELCHTFFTSGGFMAVDRLKFLQIGGFDILYYPAYVEDVDLCFRAWRNGWRCIFAPASRVLHREGGSWKTVKDSSLDAKLLRNSLLFQWSYFPTNQDKCSRWSSVAKISLGGLLCLKVQWLKTYLSSLIEIQRLKKLRKYAPIEIKHLEKILRQIKKPTFR